MNNTKNKQGRKAKKSLRKQYEQKLLNKGYSKKAIKNQTFTELQKDYKTVVKKEEKVKKQRDLDHRKNQVLKALGYDNTTVAERRKIKWKDLEKKQKQNLDVLQGKKVTDQNPLSRENYPFLNKDEYNFNYSKVYYFPKDKGLYIAFLDYSGENSVEDLMKRFDKYSDAELITFLEGIINTPKTYNKKAPNNGKGTSSGRAGTYRLRLASESMAKKLYDNNNANLVEEFNKNSKRYHTGTNQYWQTFSEYGEYTIKSISGHELLVILNTLLYNVTEDTREFYKGTYNTIVNAIPDFKKILPKP